MNHVDRLYELLAVNDLPLEITEEGNTSLEYDLEDAEKWGAIGGFVSRERGEAVAELVNAVPQLLDLAEKAQVFAYNRRRDGVYLTDRTVAALTALYSAVDALYGTGPAELDLG